MSEKRLANQPPRLEQLRKRIKEQEQALQRLHRELAQLVIEMEEVLRPPSAKRGK